MSSSEAKTTSRCSRRMTWMKRPASPRQQMQQHQHQRGQSKRSLAAAGEIRGRKVVFNPKMRCLSLVEMTCRDARRRYPTRAPADLTSASPPSPFLLLFGLGSHRPFGTKGEGQREGGREGMGEGEEGMNGEEGRKGAREGGEGGTHTHRRQ